MKTRRLKALVTGLCTAIMLAVPYAPPAAANHGTRLMEVAPELGSQAAGSPITLTACLGSGSAQFDDTDLFNGDCNGEPVTVATGAINVDFENESNGAGACGANDAAQTFPGCNSPTNPDLFCSIPAGANSCSVSYTGSVPGVDIWRVWIDHDGSNATTEADATEGRYAGSTSVSDTDCDPVPSVDPPEMQDPAWCADGDQPTTGSSPGLPNCAAMGDAESDCTDVIRITWTPAGATVLDCDDEDKNSTKDTEREDNPGEGGEASNEVYTCTALDSQGNPAGTANVRAEIESGPNDPDSQAEGGVDGPSHNSPDYNTGSCTADDPRTPGTTESTTGTCYLKIVQAEAETGVAVICFWLFVANFPPGTGNNGGSVCGAETIDENSTLGPNGRTDTGNDRADKVQKTWIGGTQAFSLDVEPETDNNLPGEPHTITATVFDQFSAQFDGSTEVNFEFFLNSPNDISADTGGPDGNTPIFPDATCNTTDQSTPGANSTCSITYNSTETGTDRLCAWIGDFNEGTGPLMTGDNVNGTCEGESLNDPDDDPTTTDAPQPITDRIDVVQKVWYTQNAAQSKLDCTPETASVPTASPHSITCTVTDQFGRPFFSANVDFENETPNVNDPDDNSVRTSPDTPGPPPKCTTPSGPSGNGTCQVTYPSENQPGTATIRAWIDTDNNDATDNADGGEIQADNDNDGTDVVTVTWQPNAACGDGTDNDADGKTDHPADPGCTSASDTSENEQCNDGADNDQDGKVDHPADPGCTSKTDDSEVDPPACSDTIDNDTDGKTDHPADPGCSSPQDADEADVQQCRDNKDNDNDGRIDHPNDPGCSSPNDDTETDTTQCNDATDNDGDGKIDHPNDPGCSSPTDNTEADDPQCDDGSDNDNDGKTDHPADPGCSSPTDDDETDAPTETECSDGADNDSDGQTDLADPGCSSAEDDSEDTEGSETVKVASDVSVKYRKGSFRGRVSSSDDRCESQRAVKIKKVTKGKPKSAGSGTTNGAGKYKIPDQGAEGRFYATVRSRRITLPTGDTLVCRKDRSPPIKVQ